MDRAHSVETPQPSDRRHELLMRLRGIVSAIAASREEPRQAGPRCHRRAAAIGEHQLAAFEDQLVGKLQLIVYGTHSPDWMSALSPSAAVWSRIGLVGHVAQVPASTDDAKDCLRPGLYPVFLPLMESHTRALPAGAASLTPTAEVIDILENKDLFGLYLEEYGLADFAPRHFWSFEEVQYPCVFKPAGLNAGNGVAVIFTKEELQAAIAGHTIDKGRYLLQSLTASAEEFVTHAVLHDGKVIWDTTFLYMLDGAAVIRTGQVTGACEVRRVATSSAMRGLLDRIGRDLGLSGPVNVDYKIIDGAPVIFEINPRLGGSLMRPENADLLGEALGHIIRWAAASETFMAAVIRRSALFDAGFYMGNGHEFEPRPTDPALHYLQTGCAEGRDPSADFSTNDYIALNFDQQLAGVNPLIHYELQGRVRDLPVQRADRRAVKLACAREAGPSARISRRPQLFPAARRVQISGTGLLHQLHHAAADLLLAKRRDEATREQAIEGKTFLSRLTSTEAQRLIEERKLATVHNSWHYSWDIERFFDSLYLYESGSHSYVFNATPIAYVSAPCPLFSDDPRLTRIMARQGRFFPYWFLRYGSFAEFLDRRSQLSGSASTNFPSRQTYPRYIRKRVGLVQRLQLMSSIELFERAFTRWKPERFNFSGSDCVKFYLGANPAVPREWFHVYAISAPGDDTIRGVLLTIEDGRSAALLNLANDRNYGLIMIVEAMRFMADLGYSSVNMGVSGLYGHYKDNVMLDTLETDASGYLPLP